MGIIKTDKLVFEYIRRDEEGNVEGITRAVDEVDLDVQQGDFIAVLGHNGSGKSTLAKHINAILYPTEGTVWVNGMDTKDEKDLWNIRQEAGMVFQNPDNQIIGQVVEEDVGFGPENMGIPTEEIWARVEESLKAVGMYKYRKFSPNKLSGGQKQRVAIARALATDPKVLLCDEATSALDPQTTHSILKLLKQLNAQLGITIVMITHEMAVIKEICDRVAVMDQGNVVEEGEVFEVFANPAQPITKAFINTTSVLRKVYELLEEDSPVVKLAPGEKLLKLQYLEKSVSESLISGISRKFDLDCNIIFANIEIIGEAPLGGTVIIANGTPEAMEGAIRYLNDRNISVEVLKDGSDT